SSRTKRAAQSSFAWYSGSVENSHMAQLLLSGDLGEMCGAGQHARHYGLHGFVRRMAGLAVEIAEVPTLHDDRELEERERHVERQVRNIEPGLLGIAGGQRRAGRK